MIYQRQKTLLALLQALGGSLGSLDFQKLLFLFCKEWEQEPSYEFVPYRFGGFSFTSYADKRKLIEKGLLHNKEKIWELTDNGRETVKAMRPLLARAQRFADLNEDKRGDTLVAQIYRKYPFHAIRSEMAERVLNGDKKALEAIKGSVPNKGIPGICTIGYEGKSLEAYLNALLLDGVNLLCDVRRNPLSRKYGFSKGVLSSCCEKVGIRYEHLPELGIDSSLRQNLQDDEDYEELFSHYERDSLPHQTKSLAIIRSWVDEGYRVALTCFELEPHQCHRHCVAEALEAQFGGDFTPHHL